MREPLKPHSLAKPYQTKENAGLGWHNGYHICSNTCFVPGCGTGIKIGRFFCFKHFAELSPRIKSRLMKGDKSAVREGLNSLTEKVTS